MTSLLIIKDNINEIKKFCDRKGINYELYNSTTPNFQQLRAKKIAMFADYGEVLKDKKLEAEKAELERADENDEYDEYDQEKWAK